MSKRKNNGGRPTLLTPKARQTALDMACRDASIVEIAAALGYNDHSTFLRAAKRNATFATQFAAARQIGLQARIEDMDATRRAARELVKKALSRALARLDGEPVDEDEAADALVLRMMPRFSDVVPPERVETTANRVTEVSVRIVEPDGSFETRTMRAESADT